MNKKRNCLCALLINLLILPMWGQQMEQSIELPDVDAAILSTELLQTDSMSQACKMMEMAGVHLLDSCYGTAHYSYLMPDCVVRFTLTRQRNGSRLRTVSFSAPAVERMLPKVLKQLGYQLVERQKGCAKYRHRRLPIRATLDYQPTWHISSMMFQLLEE